jgi:type 1 glutamine amidotransferase
MRISLLCLCAAAVFIAVLPLTASDQLTPKQNTKKIVLLGMNTDHAKGEHEYMAGLALLAECLKQTPGVEVTVIQAPEVMKGMGKSWPPGWPAEAKALEDANCIVCFCRTAGTYFLGDAERRAKFDEIMKKGAGFVSLHWAVETTKQLGDPFMAVLGGYYEPGYSDNPHNTSNVEQPNPKHPIANGWKPFEARDEFYYKIRLMPSAKPVFSATVKDRKGNVFKDETIGWVYERENNKGPLGNGRSFGFTGGHFHLNWGIPEFRRMVVNGILWTAEIDVPAGGAPVDLSAPVPKIPDGKKGR